MLLIWFLNLVCLLQSLYPFKWRVKKVVKNNLWKHLVSACAARSNWWLKEPQAPWMHAVSATARTKWYVSKFNKKFVIKCHNLSTCKSKATEEGEGVKPPTFGKECTVSPWESSEKLSNPKLRNLQSSRPIRKSFSNYKLRQKTWSDYFDNSCKVPRNWCFDQKRSPDC